MCHQPLSSSLSPSSAKLMIMALEEYGYQSRRGMRVPNKWRSSYSGIRRFANTGGDLNIKLDGELLKFLAVCLFYLGGELLIGSGLLRQIWRRFAKTEQQRFEI
ncbi:hypothetical protein Tco_1144420 [Tanacetum coccineum]